MPRSLPPLRGSTGWSFVICGLTPAAMRYRRFAAQFRESNGWPKLIGTSESSSSMPTVDFDLTVFDRLLVSPGTTNVDAIDG
jgi:hypothetical protein